MTTQLNTLTAEECDKLLNHLQDPPNNTATPRVHHRNYTMALLMLDAGCRVGELVQLRQDQLWFARCAVGALTIEKSQAKNKHERTIPLSDRLNDAIQKMHEWWWTGDHDHGTRYAFYATWCMRPLTVRQIQRIITSAGKLSIGRDIHPHLLRHTFGTRLMNITSMRTVQELLGHTRLSSTQVYTHPSGADKRKAIDSMNKTEQN
ncbi:Tyrosine recombinase XerC [subsurface metagenome]